MKANSEHMAFVHKYKYLCKYLTVICLYAFTYAQIITHFCCCAHFNKHFAIANFACFQFNTVNCGWWWCGSINNKLAQHCVYVISKCENGTLAWKYMFICMWVCVCVCCSKCWLSTIWVCDLNLFTCFRIKSKIIKLCINIDRCI